MKTYLYLLLVGVLVLTFSCQRKLSGDFAKEAVSVGIVVSDLDRSLDFYTNVIGMKVTGGFTLDEDFGRRSGLTGGQSVNVVTLKLVNNEKASEWKLLTFNRPNTNVRSRYIQDDVGMQYVTIRVNDLDPILERVDQAGIRRLGDTPIERNKKDWFLLIQDPDGVFIELIGPR